MLVGVINLGVALALAYQKTDFLQSFELALDIAGIFFYQLRKASDVGPEIRILGIDHDYLSPNPTCNKCVEHKPLYCYSDNV